MSTATDAPDAPEATASPELEAQPSRVSSRAQLYSWQTWIHVGPGAENCEEVNEDTPEVSCADPLHFHAWVRLPNPFDAETIREHGLAAKARRMRLLREEGTNLNVILESELEALARRGEGARKQIIDEIVSHESWRTLLEATRDLQIEREDFDDDDSPLKWQGIEADRLRLFELRDVETPDGEENPHEDEIRSLQSRVEAYDAGIEERRREILKPQRDELEELDMEDLVDRLRDSRVDEQGSLTYQNEYAEQEWLLCTYRWPEGPLHFAERAELRRQPSDILAALARTFSDLEREKGGLAQGN